jgi:hypothetical protein
LGDLVVPELPGGLRVAVVGFGRIGEEGAVDGHLFPVSVGVRSPGVSVEKGLRNGASLSMGALLEEPGGGLPFQGP